MESSTILKKGYLYCLVRGLPGEPFQWPHRFYILFSPSFNSRARLDCYSNENEYQNDPKTRTTVYVEELSCVERNAKVDRSHVFDVHTKAGKVRSYAAESIAEMVSWMDQLEYCMSLSSSGVGDDSRTNSLEDYEENLLYQSADAPERFEVEVTATEASIRCGLSDKCLLLITSANITLQDEEGVLRYVWPYRYIRRYGRSKTTFTLEAGRKCNSGEGLFQFAAEDGEAIFTAVQTRANAMRKAEKPNRPSLGLAPSLPERNYQSDNVPPGSPVSSQSNTDSVSSRVQMFENDNVKTPEGSADVHAPGGPPSHAWKAPGSDGVKNRRPDLPKKPREYQSPPSSSAVPPAAMEELRAKLSRTLSGEKGGPPTLRPRQQPPPPPDRQFATYHGQKVGPLPVIKGSKSSPLPQNKMPPLSGLYNPDLGEYDLAKKPYPSLSSNRATDAYADADVYNDTAVKLVLNYSHTKTHMPAAAPNKNVEAHEYAEYDIARSSRHSNLDLPPPPPEQEELYDEPETLPQQGAAGGQKMSEIFAQLARKPAQTEEEVYYDRIDLRRGQQRQQNLAQTNLYGHLAACTNKPPEPSSTEECEYDEVRVGP